MVRLEWSADLKSTTPIAQSKIMIRYDLVEIGGTTHMRPVRSVAMMRTRSVVEASEWDVSVNRANTSRLHPRIRRQVTWLLRGRLDPDMV